MESTKLDIIMLMFGIMEILASIVLYKAFMPLVTLPFLIVVEIFFGILLFCAAKLNDLTLKQSIVVGTLAAAMPGLIAIGGELTCLFLNEDNVILVTDIKDIAHYIIGCSAVAVFLKVEN